MPSSYTIGDHYEAFVRDLVESGRYASASEVVRAGLRLLEEAEEERAVKLAELRRLIQEGLDSGPSEYLDMDELKASFERRRAALSRKTANGR